VDWAAVAGGRVDAAQVAGGASGGLDGGGAAGARRPNARADVPIGGARDGGTGGSGGQGRQLVGGTVGSTRG